jgi:transketolase
MRSTFVNKLIKLAENNNKIVLFTGDLGYTVLEPFIEKFPDRFFNFGIAEQNMVGAAAGMASEGYHVFVYSIANFPVFRSAEQFRNDVDYHKLNVTIVSVGGGLSYGSLGYSHHAIQDFALMRVMPNNTILAPGDNEEVSYVLDYIIDKPGPSYLRLGKIREMPNDSECDWSNGVYLPISGPYKQNVLLSTGNTKDIAKKMILSNIEYSEYAHVSCPIWGKKHGDYYLNLLEKYQSVVTIEDHLLDGGFGSWINEILINSQLNTRIQKNVALNSTILGAVGSEEFLMKLGGLI